MLVEIKAEFHCHSIYSSDSLASFEKLISTACNKGIKKLAITDHSNIEGALLAKKMAPDLIVVGEEVKTDRGEILAYFLSEGLPKGIKPEEAFKRLKDQGAFISLSHPFDSNREHWTEEEIERFLPYLDAIEVFNSRCMGKEPNARAFAFAISHNLGCMVGSDAHVHAEVGRSTLSLPDFHDPDTLRAALKSARAETKLSSPLIHFTSRYAYIKKAMQKSREVKRNSR
jgi:predicted metal-dependent phosphoesterase TrpH